MLFNISGHNLRRLILVAWEEKERIEDDFHYKCCLTPGIHSAKKSIMLWI